MDPREYADTLHEDLVIRKTLLNCPETKGADIADIEIIRHPQRITVVIQTSRPGIIIGAKGSNIEKIETGCRQSQERRFRLRSKKSNSLKVMRRLSR